MTSEPFSLDRDEVLTLAMDQAVYTSRQEGWRDNPVKIRKVKFAIKDVLKDDEAKTDRILELVKNQDEY